MGGTNVAYCFCVETLAIRNKVFRSCKLVDVTQTLENALGYTSKYIFPAYFFGLQINVKCKWNQL